jgi:hypothetical protein
VIESFVANECLCGLLWTGAHNPENQVSQGEYISWSQFQQDILIAYRSSRTVTEFTIEPIGWLVRLNFSQDME